MCMSDLLTVAEYSKARNCSVSAVYKRLKSPSNNIHNFKVIIDGTTYLKREILVAEGDTQAFLDKLTDMTAGTVEGMETGQEYRAFPV